jgi:hypothetical protein
MTEEQFDPLEERLRDFGLEMPPPHLKERMLRRYRHTQFRGALVRVAALIVIGVSIILNVLIEQAGEPPQPPRAASPPAEQESLYAGEFALGSPRLAGRWPARFDPQRIVDYREVLTRL